MPKLGVRTLVKIMRSLLRGGTVVVGAEIDGGTLHITRPHSTIVGCHFRNVPGPAIQVSR